MKNLKRILISLPIALILVCAIGIAVLAVVGDVTDLVAIPSASGTSVSLTWAIAPSSTSTVIRELTTGYPTDPTGVADSSVLVYPPLGSSGTDNNYIQTGLTAGTTYYYSAWGKSGSSYSGTVANFFVTTSSNPFPNGTLSPPPVQPTPTEPSSAAWYTNLQPFSGFVQNFENSWGMATDLMQFTMGILILLAVGFIVYIKFKSPLIAICADLVIDLGLIGMGLLPLYTVAVVLALGLGVWALENIWI